MRLTTILLLLLAVTAPTFAGDPLFLVRKRVSEVHFMLVATDRHNRPLAHLSPSDITVLEDGRPISRFQLRSAAELPLRIAVVLDLSDSTAKSWKAIKTSLANSLQQLIRPGDQLLLLTFNSKIELERIVDRPEDLASLLANPRSGGLTALYDTLFHACDQQLFQDEREPHRSAMILFSDGEDDLSLHGLNDAIARAERRGVSIYTVATHDPRKNSPGDGILRDLAATTGGRDYIVKNANQLSQALSGINNELRSSYLLYYPVPAESGNRGFRRVRVLPSQSDGSQLRSRAGYFTAP